MKQLKPEVGSIMVVGTLACCALLHSTCYVQCSLIQEFMSYDFKLGYNTTETIKSTCWVNNKRAVD